MTRRLTALSLTFVGTVELPRLRKVGKDVRRDGAPAPKNPNDPAQVTRLRLPNLTQIGGDLWFYLDFNLIELDLRSLETIGGRAWIYRDTLIDTLRLDALGTVGADFNLADVSLRQRRRQATDRGAKPRPVTGPSRAALAVATVSRRS